MTPQARVQAAIEVLDVLGPDMPAERALTNWARKNRFAGSKDRAALRDIVFDVLRKRASSAALGGGEDGRSLIIGWLRGRGLDPEATFSGEGYGPAVLTGAEIAAGIAPQALSSSQQCDLPDWLWPHWLEALGDEATEAAMIARERGPVALRVNLRKSNLHSASELLARDGITTRAIPDVKTGLQVIENERRINQSRALRDGIVEVQDASSQIAMFWLGLEKGATVLDFCAGGGGKSLALADLFDAKLHAHDASARRMKDIPARAARAGAEITLLAPNAISPTQKFDVVLVDAPCSGSGTWRRTPEAKWALTQERLQNYQTIQREILQNASRYVAPGGALIYATCSVLSEENAAQAIWLQGALPDFALVRSMQLAPSKMNDGFYCAVFKQ